MGQIRTTLRAVARWSIPVAVLAGLVLPGIDARRVAAGPPVTLSVYTCCGSLAGFNDTNPAHTTAMHSIFGRLLAQDYPALRWQETAFSDQSTMLVRLSAAIAAGTAPDLVFIQGGAIGYTVLRGLAQPLDRFMSSAGVADSLFLPGMARWAHFGGHWWAIPAVSGPLGGQQIFLPRYTKPLGYGSRNLGTFADFYRLSQKAVRFDAAGNLLRIGYWPGAASWETVGTLMCPPGHGLYNAADQPTATDPCNRAYLTYLKKLVTLYGGYERLLAFLARDPDFLNGNKHAYLATGQAILPSSGFAYWNVSALDANTFGVNGGLTYQITTMPVTVHGTMAEAANYPSTLQEAIIPRGARHAATAFAVSKLLFWDHGYLLGLATSGSPVRSGLNQWLGEVIAGEGMLRKLAGLPGNPVASLQALKLQPSLGLQSKASNPINPVDPYYQQQLNLATTRVLLGQQAPAQALMQVQQQVLTRERALARTYGLWNW